VRQALDVQVESVRVASFDEVIAFLLTSTSLDRGFPGLREWSGFCYNYSYEA
jgi:hypothetical protein